VPTVLEGSVRSVGNRLRVTVQLTNVADGFNLWSERFDRELRDIFEVQDEITLGIVEKLKVKLAPHRNISCGGRDREEDWKHTTFILRGSTTGIARLKKALTGQFIALKRLRR